MNAKELVALLIRQLPDDCNHADIRREVYVAKEIFKALKDVEAQSATTAANAVQQFNAQTPQWRAAAQRKIDADSPPVGSSPNS